jgi:hypothetical protein
MSSAAISKKRTLATDKEPAGEVLRETVLESLLQLHIDFGVLGCIKDAGPLLYKLMEIAYFAKPDQKRRRRAKPRKRAPRSLLH